MPTGCCFCSYHKMNCHALGAGQVYFTCSFEEDPGCQAEAIHHCFSQSSVLQFSYVLVGLAVPMEGLAKARDGHGLWSHKHTSQRHPQLRTSQTQIVQLQRWHSSAKLCKQEWLRWRRCRKLGSTLLVMTYSYSTSIAGKKCSWCVPLVCTLKCLRFLNVAKLLCVQSCWLKVAGRPHARTELNDRCLAAVDMLYTVNVGSHTLTT